MKAISFVALPAQALQELDELYRTTKLARMRTRAQMVLLSAEQGLKAGQIAGWYVIVSERSSGGFIGIRLKECKGFMMLPEAANPAK